MKMDQYGLWIHAGDHRRINVGRHRIAGRGTMSRTHGAGHFIILCGFCDRGLGVGVQRIQDRL
jgi:hypothetical protein